MFHDHYKLNKVLENGTFKVQTIVIVISYKSHAFENRDNTKSDEGNKSIILRINLYSGFWKKYRLVGKEFG